MKVEVARLGTVFIRLEKEDIPPCTSCRYWNGTECERREEEPEDCFEPKRRDR